MTTLITGATGGLGRELALLFANDDHDLLLTARHADQLAELQAELTKQFHVHVTSVVLDLSDTEAAEKLFRYAQEKGIVIDTLVNCAGFGDWADFMHEDRRKLNAMMQVNMVTLAKLMRLFGEGMVSRHDGRILNIASVAATIPGPYMAAYYASKAFVRSLSVAVAHEVRGTGLTVTCICPGPISTGFEKAAAMQGRNFFMMVRPSTPKAIAQFAYHKMQLGRALGYAGAFAKGVAFATRLAPEYLNALRAGFMNGGDPSATTSSENPQK